MREIDNLVGDNMDDAGGILQFSGHGNEPRAENGGAEFLEDRRPDDHIGAGGFVFQRREDHAIGGARALAHQHEPADGDAAAGRQAGKLLVAQNIAPLEFAAQERHRMRLERQMQMPIILDHLLAGRHRRQMRVGLDLVHGRARKQRQIVLVAGAAQGADRP